LRCRDQSRIGHLQAQAAFLAFGRAVLYLFIVFRFCALRAQKRKTIETGSTMLPQAKATLK
jgi:hypothetical protein